MVDPALPAGTPSVGPHQASLPNGPSAGYDCNGNVLTDQAGQRRFSGARPGTAMAGPGDAENHLIGVTAPGLASTLSYDPIGRLNHIVTNGRATNFVWDGDDLLMEYDGSGFTLRRFMHGPGDDNPLIWFEGPTMDQTHQQLLIADHQGSIVGVTNAAGALTSSLTYDPYGSTPSFAGPRFRYTGQIAIPEIGLYYYKARFYDPVAQRFLQTDPIGMKDDENLYAYVHEDPVDRTDSSGMCIEDFCIVEAAAAVAGCSANPGCRGFFGALFGGAVGSGAYALKQSIGGHRIQGETLAKEGFKGAVVGGVSAATLNPHAAAAAAAATEGADRAYERASSGGSALQIARAGAEGAAEAGATSYVGGKVAGALSPVKFPTQEAASAAAGAAIAPVVASATHAAHSASRYIPAAHSVLETGSRIPRPVREGTK